MRPRPIPGLARGDRPTGHLADHRAPHSRFDVPICEGCLGRARSKKIAGFPAACDPGLIHAARVRCPHGSRKGANHPAQNRECSFERLPDQTSTSSLATYSGWKHSESPAAAHSGRWPDRPIPECAHLAKTSMPCTFVSRSLQGGTRPLVHVDRAGPNQSCPGRRRRETAIAPFANSHLIYDRDFPSRSGRRGYRRLETNRVNYQ